MAEKKGIGKLSGATSEAKRLYEAEQANRDAANKILPLSGTQAEKWRVAKHLSTTLGGDEWSQPRPITKQDLKDFQAKLKALGNYVIKGVTANEVMLLSRDIDKKRAKQEITNAVPVTIKGGIIHFIANASPQSKDTRHHVMVQLNDWEKAMQLGTALQAAKYAAQGNLKFDCDCGRHTFWYRFIVTQMGANYGRAEMGMPKIRNPNLTGIGCKHVLRVMTELHSSIFVHRRIAAAIEADRKVLADKTRPNKQKTVRLTDKEAKELLAKQEKNNRSVSGKVDANELARRQAQEQQKLSNAAKKAKPPKKTAKPMSEAEFKRTLANMRNLGFSQKEIDKAIAKRNAQKGN